MHKTWAVMQKKRLLVSCQLSGQCLFTARIDSFSLFLEFWGSRRESRHPGTGFRSILLSVYDQLRNIIITLVDEGRKNRNFTAGMWIVSPLLQDWWGTMDGMMPPGMDGPKVRCTAGSRFHVINTLIRGMKTMKKRFFNSGGSFLGLLASTAFCRGNRMQRRLWQRPGIYMRGKNFSVYSLQ